MVAIPVSLIGTCAVMQAFGFSLNMLTLFGLVLAVGIVVDDAIVVVENVERKLKEGLSPLEAARVSMDEVGTALIAIALVLLAVFIPTTFIGGITGQFYRQFAVTIATATAISLFLSLTLSPALCALLFQHARRTSMPRLAADAARACLLPPVRPAPSTRWRWAMAGWCAAWRARGCRCWSCYVLLHGVRRLVRAAPADRLHSRPSTGRS